jgi:hypothetical protein
VGAPPETRVITQIQSNQDPSHAGEGLQLRGKQRWVDVSEGCEIPLDGCSRLIFHRLSNLKQPSWFNQLG